VNGGCSPFNRDSRRSASFLKKELPNYPDPSSHRRLLQYTPRPRWVIQRRAEPSGRCLLLPNQAVPVITGVHSIVTVDSTTVSAIFDIAPDTSGSRLHFQFELPRGGTGRC
jgi:hypothetical protein